MTLEELLLKYADYHYKMEPENGSLWLGFKDALSLLMPVVNAVEIEKDLFNWRDRDQNCINTKNALNELKKNLDRYKND